MQAAALQRSDDLLDHWTDLWLADNKQAGYIAVARRHAGGKIFNSHFLGYRDRQLLIQETQDQKDRYISLNSFDVSWNDIAHSRRTERLKQIRVIGVDIDQYKLELKPIDVYCELERLIKSGQILTPNLVCEGNGIQIFYSIEGGAAPCMQRFTKHITKQLIKTLAHIGADPQASSVAQIMRAPGSINTRNGATVIPEIWNQESYTLQELIDSVAPIYQGTAKGKTTAATKREKTVAAPATGKSIEPINEPSMAMFRTNGARLHDLEALFRLRDYDLTGMRNTALYIYAFTLATMMSDKINKEKMFEQARNQAQQMKTRDPKAEALSDSEIESTIRSAYEGARAFVSWYTSNDFKLIKVDLDGIYKPMTTETIIERLAITDQEQQHMRTLARPEIVQENRRRHDRERKEKQNREKGVRPIEEHKQERQKARQAKRNQLIRLQAKYPDRTQKEYAKMMKVNQATVSKLLKEIELSPQPQYCP